jgi:uncharacterized damage-inducible protein DinB
VEEATVKQADLITLFDYNYWANSRILTAAARVTQEQLVSPTAFPRGSLRGTLLHILDAEYGWRMLLQEAREADDLAEADFPTLPTLLMFWREEEGTMRGYLASLDDEKVNSIVRYTNPQGIRRERVLWHGLLHVVNHGTQHRSEAAALLTGYGQSPGDFDFSIFTAEHLQQAA